MTPPKFLVGVLANGEQRWASIDTTAHHVQAEVAERRFGAYLRPFRDELSAREALRAAGALDVDVEAGKKRRGR